MIGPRKQELTTPRAVAVVRLSCAAGWAPWGRAAWRRRSAGRSRRGPAGAAAPARGGAGGGGGRGGGARLL
jgi:hypothetical protein